MDLWAESPMAVMKVKRQLRKSGMMVLPKG
jgi:hypothetical protein